MDPMLKMKSVAHLRIHVSRVAEIVMETLNVREDLCVGKTIATARNFHQAIQIAVKKVPP